MFKKICEVVIFFYYKKIDFITKLHRVTHIILHKIWNDFLYLWIKVFIHVWQELLGDNGVLILPTFSTPAPAHYRMYSRVLNCVYLVIFNLLEMPATACPMGFSSNGMPIGVQVFYFSIIFSF